MNAEKGKSFGWAFARMKEAQSAGFFVEAAALAESVISDRLHSFLLGNGEVFLKKDGKVVARPPFEMLRQRVGRYLEPHDPFTAEEIQTFQKARNRSIHEVARSFPGEKTIPLGEWLKHAETAAVLGVRLAREVADWHRKHLRASKAAKRADVLAAKERR